MTSASLVRGLDDGPVAVSSVLHPLTVYARRPGAIESTLSRLLATVVVDIFEIECVKVAREVARHPVNCVSAES
jgi:hypothetical protein